MGYRFEKEIARPKCDAIKQGLDKITEELQNVQTTISKVEHNSADDTQMQQIIPELNEVISVLFQEVHDITAAWARLQIEIYKLEEDEK